MKDNTQRFSNRVEDYVRYRPHYPNQILSFLETDYNLTSDKIIADIGSGTGISTEMFLKAGYTVFAVEPNKEMREKSISLLEGYHSFTAIDGTAEHTTIADHSIDTIIAGQAFHWFDLPKTKTEFKRVLKTDGFVVLFWNERLTDSDFEKEYDLLIKKHGNDYVQVDHRNIDMDNISAFFAPGPCRIQTFENFQAFDFDGLKGRLLSSSYMPNIGDDGYENMIEALATLYKKYAEDDQIKINYTTKVYVGHFE